jgi:hypothetical protein
MYGVADLAGAMSDPRKERNFEFERCIGLAYLWLNYLWHCIIRISSLAVIRINRATLSLTLINIRPVHIIDHQRRHCHQMLSNPPFICYCSSSETSWSWKNVIQRLQSPSMPIYNSVLWSYSPVIWPLVCNVDVWTTPHHYFLSSGCFVIDTRAKSKWWCIEFVCRLSKMFPWEEISVHWRVPPIGQRNWLFDHRGQPTCKCTHYECSGLPFGPAADGTYARANVRTYITCWRDQDVLGSKSRFMFNSHPHKLSTQDLCYYY